MAAAKPRPYRRILTSALHRRFVHASALSVLVCYIISVVIGDKSSCKYLPIESKRQHLAHMIANERPTPQYSGPCSQSDHAVSALSFSSYLLFPYSSYGLVKCTLARERPLPRSRLSNTYSRFTSFKPLRGIFSRRGGSAKYTSGPHPLVRN